MSYPTLQEAWRLCEEQSAVLDGCYRGEGQEAYFCFDAGRFFGDVWRRNNGRWVASAATVDNGTNRLAPCDALPGEYDNWEDGARALWERMSKPLDAAVAILREVQG